MSHSLLNAELAKDWAKEIRRLWAQGGLRTVELAKTVLTAKLELRRGEWTALWLDGNMPFSKRKAEMLVVIGRQLGWANAQTFAHLPHGWSILYYLARLDRAVLEDLIERGVVNTGLKLFQAKDLIRLGGRVALAFKSPPISSRLNRFCNFVKGTHGLWSQDQRQIVTDQLQEILCLIECAPLNEINELSE